MGGVKTLGTTAAVVGMVAALAGRRPRLASALAIGALVLLRPRRTARDGHRSDKRLDEALADTFPASDALSLHQVGRGR
jgi:hypothetical protein